MKFYNKLILLLFLICLPYLFAKCSDQEQNVLCYDNRSQIQNNECNNNLNIELNIKNQQNGIIEGKFNIVPNCAFNKFELDLQIDVNNLSKGECIEGDTSSKNWTKHTHLNYIRDSYKQELLPCNETALLYFDHIYTGCYKLSIKAYMNNTTFNNDFQVKFLETKYEKKIINLQTKREYNDKYKTAYIEIAFNKTFTNKIHLSFALTNETAEFNWIANCPLTTNLEDCNVTDKFNIVTCTSTNDKNQKITCDLKNIYFGKYFVTIKILDEPVRCNWLDNSVWFPESGSLFNCCEYYYTLTLNSITLSENPMMEVEAFNYTSIVFIIIALLIIIIVTIILYIRRNPNNSVNDYGNYTRYEYRSNEKFNVFLLYARDCEAVMDAMKAFKDVLEEFLDCTVYDIHDPTTSQELSRAPKPWVFSKLSGCGARFKTLLVATRCGNILLQHRRPDALYKHQRCYDDLFPLAIRTIEDMGLCSNSASLFVLNFNADTQQCFESFKTFTPGKRFTLPLLESLQTLFLQLECEISVIDLQESQRVQIFYEKCRLLDTFLDNYPKYLSSILNVEIEVL